MLSLVESAAHRMEAGGLHFGHGTDNAFDEACWMASYCLKLPPDFPAEAFEQPVSPAAQSRFERLLDQRMTTRKPLAYLIGEAWFAGLRFEVDESVLVPRSPLAELIVHGFEPWLSERQLRRAVDVGTGSGCIAIALAAQFANLQVDAVDVSPAALAVARRNVAMYGLTDRVGVRESDLLEALSDHRYDLVLANPPYVPEASMKTLPPEFGWEPELGLVAGVDGLDLVRRLIIQAARCLQPHGILVCEVGEAADAVDAWLKDVELTWLAFEHGGDGVFLLDRKACRTIADAVRARSG
jgi:ribosomal protein L3 glutamine methyltransferase